MVFIAEFAFCLLQFLFIAFLILLLKFGLQIKGIVLYCSNKMALDYTFNLYSHMLSAKSEIFISLLNYHPDNIVNCDQVHTIIIIHHFAQF